ncbi:hypothetical protein NH286_04530 [Anaerococcus sp. NML200574]|uniref:hypothetical protein n=1 Tax=Anaerococcus sp. NML200574 TaxID=2954486 RepID=UPI0022383B78|nr:hypothetical protein [Anaerococcus sp. NML200574]MCW6678417.1 hypothetical protein [Anaerococcus sp. NML200574]
MKKIDNIKIYTGTFILGILILTICFIYRYSYIDILGFKRPLALASVICAGLGILGSLIGLIDGVDKHFRSPILGLIVLNLVLIFTYPILISLEKALAPVASPYKTTSPEIAQSTKFKSDSSFIIEGKLYQFPLKLKNFTQNGFTYSTKDENGKIIATISREGDSYHPNPTWFTDGVNNEVYKEFYLLEAYFNMDLDSIENKEIKSLKASVINNNRDFEVRGVKLEDSIYDLQNRFKDELTEDPNNQNQTMKAYYLVASDGYKIKLETLNGIVQSIEIYKESDL